MTTAIDKVRAHRNALFSKLGLIKGVSAPATIRPSNPPAARKLSAVSEAYITSHKATVSMERRQSLAAKALVDATVIYDLWSKSEGAGKAIAKAVRGSPLMQYKAVVDALPETSMTSAQAFAALDNAYGAKWRGQLSDALENNPGFGAAKLAAALIDAKPYLDQMEAQYGAQEPSAGVSPGAAQVTARTRIDPSLKGMERVKAVIQASIDSGRTPSVRNNCISK